MLTWRAQGQFCLSDLSLFVSRLRMNGCILLLPLYVVRIWQGRIRLFLPAYGKPGFSDVSTKIRHILSQLHFTFIYIILYYFPFKVAKYKDICCDKFYAKYFKHFLFPPMLCMFCLVDIKTLVTLGRKIQCMSSKSYGPFFEETNSDTSVELIPTPLFRELWEKGKRRAISILCKNCQYFKTKAPVVCREIFSECASLA